MTTLIIDTDDFMAGAAVSVRSRLTQINDESHASWIATDTTRNTWPASLSYDTRVDVKMRDGSEFKNCRACTWAWGEARETTITHWRLSK